MDSVFVVAALFLFFFLCGLGWGLYELNEKYEALKSTHQEVEVHLQYVISKSDALFTLLTSNTDALTTILSQLESFVLSHQAITSQLHELRDGISAQGETLSLSQQALTTQLHDLHTKMQHSVVQKGVGEYVKFREERKKRQLVTATVEDDVPSDSWLKN